LSSKVEKKSKKISAKVVEYRKERAPRRNYYILLNYPYVKINLENGEYIICKLRYANNLTKSFKIREKVDVFWTINDLLYWDAFNKRIYNICLTVYLI
jgi:hypothetical protein